VFTSNLISQTTWLKVKLKLVNLIEYYKDVDTQGGQYLGTKRLGVGVDRVSELYL